MVGSFRARVVESMAPVPVLLRDQEGLERPQHGNRAGQDYRRPEDRVHPQGRRERNFEPERQSNDEKTENQNDEDRGAVATVMSGQVETADLAWLVDREESGEQFSPPAARASAGKAGLQRRDRRVVRFVHILRGGRLRQCVGALPLPHQ